MLLVKQKQKAIKREQAKVSMVTLTGTEVRRSKNAQQTLQKIESVSHTHKEQLSECRAPGDGTNKRVDSRRQNKGWHFTMGCLMFLKENRTGRAEALFKDRMNKDLGGTKERSACRD